METKYNWVHCLSNLFSEPLTFWPFFVLFLIGWNFITLRYRVVKTWVTSQRMLQHNFYLHQTRNGSNKKQSFCFRFLFAPTRKQCRLYYEIKTCVQSGSSSKQLSCLYTGTLVQESACWPSAWVSTTLHVGGNKTITQSKKRKKETKVRQTMHSVAKYPHKKQKKNWWV